MSEFQFPVDTSEDQVPVAWPQADIRTWAGIIQMLITS